MKIMGINIAVILIFLFLINNTYALTSDLKNEYNGLETVIVKIEGNIVEPITETQVEFKRKNVLVPFEFEVKKIYETNYIWFVTPRVENQTNYTLIIRDLTVQEFGQNKKIDFYANFSVRANVTDYYITPGFISTKEDYMITVNSNIDIEKKINVDFPVKQELTIPAGKTNFDFSINEIDNSLFKLIKFGLYGVPVYIIKEGAVENIENNSISISPQNINIEREIGSNKLDYSFKIINIGGNKIEDLLIKYDDEDMLIKPNSKIDLEQGQEITYNITLEKEKNISELITISSIKNNITREMNIKINFIEYPSFVNQTLINQTLQNNNSDQFYCQELTGKECFETQKCEGQIIKTKNNVSCCMGKCALISQSKGSNSWIGYLIIGIALITIVLVFIKYKKVKPSKTVLEKTLENNAEIKKLSP